MGPWAGRVVAGGDVGSVFLAEAWRSPDSSLAQPATPAATPAAPTAAFFRKVRRVVFMMGSPYGWGSGSAERVHDHHPPGRTRDASRIMRIFAGLVACPNTS